MRLTALAGALALAAVFTTAGLAGAAPNSAIRFSAPVTLGGHCGGEPGIGTDGQGDVYVTAPQFTLEGVASCEGDILGLHGGAATWTSHDDGLTFGPLVNVGSMTGGSDSDVAVDPISKRVFIADLEAGTAVDVCQSSDLGNTWFPAFAPFVGSCTSSFNLNGQAGPEDDRPWLATYGPTASYPHRDLYLAYHDFAAGIPLIYVSQDGGPFEPLPSPVSADPNFAADVTQGTLFAKPAIGKDGSINLLVTTPSPSDPGVPFGSLNELWLARSTDHGHSWKVTHVFDGAQQNAFLGLVFNNVAIDGAGDIYVLALGNVNGQVPPANAYIFSSTDNGQTFNGPFQINHNSLAHALPALYGGPFAGQVVLGYYETLSGNDPNNVNDQWRYVLGESIDGTAANPQFSFVNANNGAVVHNGDICTLGIFCETGGNRNLADFSSATVDGSGCALVVYADDSGIKADQSNYSLTLTNNEVVRQTSGCFQPSDVRGMAGGSGLHHPENGSGSGGTAYGPGYSGGTGANTDYGSGVAGVSTVSQPYVGTGRAATLNAVSDRAPSGGNAPWLLMFITGALAAATLILAFELRRSRRLRRVT